MIYRLPFKSVQDAVVNKLRSGIKGVPVHELSRIPDATTSLFIGVGNLRAEPNHATQTKLFIVTVTVQVVKLDIKGTGTDSEMFGIADKICQQLSELDTLSDNYVLVGMPWYSSANASLVNVDDTNATMVSLTFNYRVQDTL
jgi:hypothetical protein